MSTVFMIRHKPTGLFSKGGIVNYGAAILTQAKLETLTHHGKVWHTIGPLRSHLNIAKYNDDFEVVECAIQVINTCTITEQREIAAKNRKKREDARERRMAPYYLEIEQDKKKKAAEDMRRAEKEIEELKKKYPDLAN